MSHSSPALGCRCFACHAARLAIHRDLTASQRQTLAVLSFAVPRHATDLRTRDGIRWGTITSLLYRQGSRPALIRIIALREPLASALPMTVLTLHQHGDEIRAAAEHPERNAA